MVVGLLGAPHVIPLHLHVDGHLVDAVEEGHFVGRTHRPALGAGTVVAVDVDDQCVIEFAHVLDGLDDTTDFMVRVSLVGGKNFNLFDKELFFLGRAVVPLFDNLLRPWLELRIRRNHTKLLLVLEDGFTQLFPAVVEEVHIVDFLHPRFGRMMGGVGGTGCIFDEKGLVRLNLIEAVQVVYGLVGHGGGQVPPRLAFERIDLGGVLEEVGLPLVGITAHEAVEVLKAQAGGPLVEGPGLAGRESRRVVILAEPRRGVAVVQQDAADGGLVFGDNAVVAGEPGGLFGDDAEAGRVVVATGQQRGPGGRAQGGGVDVVVAQAVIGDTVHGRCGDHTAEGARNPEAGIVGDDEQDVGGLFGRHDAWCPPGLRVQGAFLDDTAECRIRRRQLLAADGGGRAGRSQFAGYLRAFTLHGGAGRQQQDSHKGNQSNRYFRFHGILLGDRKRFRFQDRLLSMMYNGRHHSN